MVAMLTIFYKTIKIGQNLSTCTVLRLL